MIRTPLDTATKLPALHFALPCVVVRTAITINVIDMPSAQLEHLGDPSLASDAGFVVVHGVRFAGHG